MERGNWNTVFKRLHDWIKGNIFQQLFDAGRHRVRHGGCNDCAGTPALTKTKGGLRARSYISAEVD